MSLYPNLGSTSPYGEWEKLGGHAAFLRCEALVHR